MRLWEVNEKTGNLLKFHFHPLWSQSRAGEIRRLWAEEKINVSFITRCFCVLGACCWSPTQVQAWLLKSLQNMSVRCVGACLTLFFCRRGVNDSWSSLSLSNFSGTAATSLKNITDTVQSTVKSWQTGSNPGNVLGKQATQMSRGRVQQAAAQQEPLFLCQTAARQRWQAFKKRVSRCVYGVFFLSFYKRKQTCFQKGEHVVAVVAMAMSTDPAPIIFLPSAGSQSWLSVRKKEAANSGSVERFLWEDELSHAEGMNVITYELRDGMWCRYN